uniref:DDE Tnp4 domain-containing protein n=1 Tax=Globodera rostochiensis TaxID=31243 RepID=A0A914HTV5_GLORO
MGVCDHQKKFIAFFCNYPGSCHDSYVLRCSQFFAKMEEATVDGIVLGDSGYPQKKWLFTPIRFPRTRHEEQYNAAHAATRVTIEQCFGIFKNRWRCLMYKSRLQPVAKVATVCSMLHNIAIDCRAPLPPMENMEEGDDMQEVNDENANWSAEATRNSYINRNF